MMRNINVSDVPKLSDDDLLSQLESSQRMFTSCLAEQKKRNIDNIQQVKDLCKALDRVRVITTKEVSRSNGTVDGSFNEITATSNVVVSDLSESEGTSKKIQKLIVPKKGSKEFS